jgi:hypothetical protein
MSDMCEHPFCTRLISNKCINHCQLDLCEEHYIEHKHLYLVQYEKSFNNLKKSLNDLINSIEEIKKTIHINYQKNISLISLKSNNKSDEMEQKSSLILTTQNLIKKKLQLLNDIKNGQALLYQYDIEQIKLYRNIIREYQPMEVDILFSSSSSSSSSSSISDFNPDSDNEEDEDYYHKSINNAKRNHIMNYYGQCPLTRLGIYGLNDKHNLRLCSAENNQSDCHLMRHFYNYHHIKWSLSYELTGAIINKLNPFKTCVFRSDINIVDKRFNIIQCSSNDLNVPNCKKKSFNDSLDQHVSKIHRLSSYTSSKIVETSQKKGHLVALDVDEDEFK